MSLRALGLYSVLTVVLLLRCAEAAGGYHPEQTTRSRLELGRSAAQPSPADSWIPSLPSSSELYDAMTRGPHFEGDSQYPWNTEGVPWINVRQMPRYKHDFADVPRFTMKDGRTYGPLGIGGLLFETKPYPLDFPHLRANWDLSSPTPTNIEGYVYGNRKLLAGDPIFRPEPQLLGDIQRTLRAPLSAAGWRSELVSGSTELKQGEYVWPPVKMYEANPSSLNMARGVGKHLHEGISYALHNWHRAESPQMYHLTVSSGNSGVRHILMTRVSAATYTDLGHESVNSDFWLLHEAVADVADPERPKYALLGGMFLPKYAPEALAKKGFFEPAFQHVIGHVL